MGILGLFRRKRKKGFFKIGPGLGLSQDDPIRIGITDWDQAREVLEKAKHQVSALDALCRNLDALCTDGPPGSTDTVVGHMWGELVKMTFLGGIFGEEGVKWTYGSRAYYESYEGLVQSQKMHMADGSVRTLWFDFSGCDPPPGP